MDRGQGWAATTLPPVPEAATTASLLKIINLHYLSSHSQSLRYSFKHFDLLHTTVCTGAIIILIFPEDVSGLKIGRANCVQSCNGEVESTMRGGEDSNMDWLQRSARVLKKAQIVCVNF